MAKRSIDVRGRSCPIPIVELMRAIREVAVGDEIEVLADDRAFLRRPRLVHQDGARAAVAR